MAMTSPTKEILEVNDEICRILGYKRSEFLQKTWAEMTHPDDLAADVAQFNRVMVGEIDGYTMDKRWIRKDGAIIDSAMSSAMHASRRQSSGGIFCRLGAGHYRARAPKKNCGAVGQLSRGTANQPDGQLVREPIYRGDLLVERILRILACRLRGW